MKKTTMGAAVFGVAVTLLAATQLSIVAIGSKSAGHTAVVLRSEAVSQLRFLDSTQAQCKSFGGFMAQSTCAGRLAIIVADQNLALVRLPYSQTLADLTTALWPRE